MPMPTSACEPASTGATQVGESHSHLEPFGSVETALCESSNASHDIVRDTRGSSFLNAPAQTPIEHILPSFFEQIMEPYNCMSEPQPFEAPPDIFNFLPEQDDWLINSDIFGPDFMPAISKALEVGTADGAPRQTTQQLNTGTAEKPCAVPDQHASDLHSGLVNRPLEYRLHEELVERLADVV